ncbi:MAG: hypothetical protein HWD92_04415 [Flavobacteriia bacterium]|nr:hypothetical protein [Flavobacteriia bacterium]
MRALNRKIVLLFFLVFAISSSLLAQGNRLVCVAMDTLLQESIFQAKIELYQNEQLIAEQESDFDGMVVFENLQPGLYTGTIDNQLNYYRGSIQLDFKGDSDTIIIPMGQPKPAPPHLEIDWQGHALFSDSLGNVWCIDLSINQVDSLDRKQGFWRYYFNDYTDTTSGFSIGQTTSEGNYSDGRKTGTWTYFNPDGTIEKTIEY